MSFFKKIFSDSHSHGDQKEIHHIQEKQCCIHPHEGCTPTKEFKEFKTTENERKTYRTKKLQSLGHNK